MGLQLSGGICYNQEGKAVFSFLAHLLMIMRFHVSLPDTLQLQTLSLSFPVLIPCVLLSIFTFAISLPSFPAVFLNASNRFLLFTPRRLSLPSLSLLLYQLLVLDVLLGGSTLLQREPKRDRQQCWWGTSETSTLLANTW